MKIWIDAQLPPALANWLSATFGLEASALRDLSLRDAQDIEIFEAARAKNAVIIIKDSDFIDLVCRLGTPPQIYNVVSRRECSARTSPKLKIRFKTRPSSTNLTQPPPDQYLNELQRQVREYYQLWPR